MLLELGIHPALIAVLLGCSFAVARLAGFNLPHDPILVAAGLSLMASELAMVPLLLARQATQATLAQAALIATVMHMFVSAGLMAVVSFKVLPGQPFLFWMCGFYWMTLISVAMVAIRSVRRASPSLPAPSAA